MSEAIHGRYSKKTFKTHEGIPGEFLKIQQDFLSILEKLHKKFFWTILLRNLQEIFQVFSRKFLPEIVSETPRRLPLGIASQISSENTTEIRLKKSPNNLQKFLQGFSVELFTKYIQKFHRKFF